MQMVTGHAQTASTVIPRKGFTLSLWAREPMLRSPVALSFDDRGRLYVVETARRSSVDIDIRSHPSWLVEDLSNQSVDDLRRFFRAKMSPENSAENASWLRDYNGDGLHDWRDLMEVKERVHLLEDVQGVGKADRAHVFAEGFNEEISGVIAGVMPWEDDVFVTVYPDLWRLRDLDGDGVADRQESLFRGFGVHAGFDGHDLHGLCVGPEGKIYFSIGDNGFSVTNKEGHLLNYPNTGGVLRMNPDGSELEVFASGLRNPQEIAFDEFGNLFAVDNDGDLEDERERFVYITEGSDSGWRIHWQFRDPGWANYTHQPNYNPWIAERMWVPHFPGQPAHITPPLSNYSVGPSGFKFNPGTALNESYKGFFFLVQFPVQKITAFQARPKGASFEMANEHLFLSGMMASSVNFSPDGALFVADWDGMWAPSGKGAIWKLDDPKAAHSAKRQEVKQLLNTGLRDRGTDELARLLGHEDMRIRQRAQFELVRRGEKARLLTLARSSETPQLARVHALWALGQAKAELKPKDLPFADLDPEIRAQSAKLAGDLRLHIAQEQLIRLLTDESLRVRFHAALALGKAGDSQAVPALTQLLAANANANSDPFLRHACVAGLTGIGQVNALAQLSQHSSTAVRIGAIVALRRLRAPEVTAFLHDPDLTVRQEAVRAIHDDRSIPDALPVLAAVLDEPNLPADEGSARRVLNANLRVGTEASARRLLRFSLDSTQAEPMRIEAVDCLGGWNIIPYLDRVEGQVRPLSQRAPNLGDQLIRDNLAALLGGATPPLAQAITRIVMRNHIEADAALFTDWVLSTNQPPSIRAQALELLADRAPASMAKLLPKALDSEMPELRLAALRLLSTKNPAAFMDFVGHQIDRLTLPEKQAALRLVGPVQAPAASALLSQFLDALRQSQLDPRLAVDVLETCRHRPEDSLKSKLADYEATLSAGDPLAKFRPALVGGDATAGSELFHSQEKAQCVRCHEAGGEGFQAGPVLAGLAGRVTPEYMLESLIEPSKRIAEGFATTSVATRDGEVIDGIKVRDTGEALLLRLSSGEIRKIARTEIEKQSTSSISAMPPMGEVLSLFEIRDLLAYLQTLK